MIQLHNNPKPLAAQLGALGDGLTPTLKPWRGVFFDGPQPDQDQEGEEIPVWIGYIGDEEAEPVGKVYKCFTFRGAQTLAGRMAKDRKLELVQEALPA